MWRSKKDIIKRRILSGILACLLVATSASNSLGIISSLAGEKTAKPRISYNYHKKQDIQITVLAENESFAPGAEVSLKIYVQNNTDQLLTEGNLKWTGKDLVDAGFPEMDMEDWWFEEDFDGEWNLGPAGTPTDAEEATPSNQNIESNGKWIRHIELAPGEVYETEFYGFVKEDLKEVKNKKITFSFVARKEGGGQVTKSQDFTYNTGMAGLLPIEFEDGNSLMTNERNTIYIRTRFEEEHLLEEFTPDYFEGNKATASDGAKETEKETTAVTKAETTASKETADSVVSEETTTEEVVKEETTAETTVKDETTAATEAETETEVESGSAAEETGTETETTEAKNVEIAAEEISLTRISTEEKESVSGAETESAAEETETEKTEDTETAPVTETTAGTESETTTAEETPAAEESGSEAETEAGTEEVTSAAAETETTAAGTSAAETTAAETTETETAITETTVKETTAAETSATDNKEFFDPDAPNMATVSDATDEGTDPKNIRYTIETYGAKLKGITAWFEEEESTWGETVTGVSFRVAENTKPGVYFGKITTSIRRNGKSYETTQGFYFYVLGEGELVLKGRINGAEIEVKGPADSFPNADMLSLKVTEVPEDKKDLVQAAMEQKAQESGISVNKMKAVDIKIIADGEETEPQGDVTVRFSNVTLEKVTLSGEITDDVEETTKEEIQETAAPAMFRMRRMAAAPAAEQAGAMEAETDGASAEAGETARGEEESMLAVWHLDEEAGVINDMDRVTVEENGDVVMTTDHFSIYIVVDMGQLGGNVTLTVEHWGKNIETINATGTTDPYRIQLDTATDTTDSEERYGYHTKDDVYNRHTKKIVIQKYNGQLYSPDTIMIPNKTQYSSIEELSKVCLVTAKKEYAEKNYQVSEIWVSTNLNNRNKATWSEWATPKKKYTVTRDSNGTITNTDKVTISKKSVIRFVYTEKKVTTPYEQPVTFYDHNVTNGLNTKEVASVPQAADQGTNRKGNFKGGENKMGVGQQASGNTSSWNNAHTDVSGLKGYLNKGNNAKGNSAGITYDSNVPDKTNGKDNSLISAVVRNEVLEDLTADYKLQFHPKISQPGFFEAKTGTKKFTNYKLGFQQKGDTYILSTVKRGKTEVLTGLQHIKYSAHNVTNDSNIYSNNFWPLDKEVYHATNYPFADPQVTGGSDGGGTHNWHFGMHYAFTFRVGDYTGPMNFYFRGDDDFWLFVDGKRAIDLGGIHFAVGQAIDMRKWLEEHGGLSGEHRIDIYYMERGGFGSCCYMQFTLPNCIPIDSKKDPQTQVTVKKEWNDYNNPNRPSDIDITLWQMHNGMKVDKGTVTLSKANNWQYTWTELPVSDPNDPTREYKYEVIEKNVPPGYDSQTIKTTGSDKKGWVITLENKLDPEVKVKVTKEWVDDNNKCDNRPDQVRFQLCADGKALAGKILTLSKANQVGNNSNMWSGEFDHLPKYRYEKDKNGNYVKNPDGTYKAVEIIYTVKELKGNAGIQEGGFFDGNHGKYTVTYADVLSASEKQNNYVAHVKVTNTHTCETVIRKAIKEWKGIPTTSGIVATANIGLYYRNGTAWEKVVKDANGQTLANPVAISWPTTAGSEEVQWTDLPKYNGSNEIKYGIFEIGTDNKPIITSGSETVLGDYKYKVTFTNAETAQVTITNELMKARLRVGKWVDNETVSEDVMKDEFIITVVSEDSKFETGVVLLPAGHGSAVSESTLTESRLSKYIEVLAKTNGSNYVIGEKTDLKEYTPSTPFVTKYSGTGTLNGAVITVMPGGDDVVLVHNTFNHKDYFHNDHSVTNEFNGSGQKPLQEAQRQVVNLFAAVPERKTYDDPEKLDEDTRLT